MVNLLFSPFGNIRRLPFFLGLIATTCMLWAALALYFFPTYFLMHKEYQHWAIALTILSYLIGLLFALGTLWGVICLHLKRLADLRLSCFFIITPFACGAAEGYFMNTPYNTVIHAISLTYYCGLLFWPSRV